MKMMSLNSPDGFWYFIFQIQKEKIKQNQMTLMLVLLWIKEADILMTVSLANSTAGCW